MRLVPIPTTRRLLRRRRGRGDVSILRRRRRAPSRSDPTGLRRGCVPPRVGFAHAVVLREVIRARVRSHAAKTPTRLRHHRARFPRDVFGGDANGGFPRHLQRVLILRHLRGEFQVGVHRAGVIPVRLERACPREHGVHRGGGFSPLGLGVAAARASRARLERNLVLLRGDVIRRDAKRIVPHARPAVHVHRRLRSFGLDEGRLGFPPFVRLGVRRRLRGEDVADALRRVLLRDAHRRRPVALVRPHVDRLFGFIRANEVFFGVCESALVFEEHGVLELDVRDLALGASALGELEGVREITSLARVVDAPVQKFELVEQGGALFAAERVGPRVRHLLGRGAAASSLGDAHRVFPLL